MKRFVNKGWIPRIKYGAGLLEFTPAKARAGMRIIPKLSDSLIKRTDMLLDSCLRRNDIKIQWVAQSFPRRRESRRDLRHWIPVFTGMTIIGRNHGQ